MMKSAEHSDTPVTKSALESSHSGSTCAQLPLLRLSNITKQFPGTLALDDVSLDVRASEVHVLFGENGAGKSTLIQIIAGVHRPTLGKIHLNGEQHSIDSVQHARALGISAVFQEFSIIPQLTVEENLFLGSEITQNGLLKKRELKKLARETLDRLGFHLRPNQLAMYLSRAEQQMIEIAKAFRTKPSIMILDEPTASLTERETERLFELIETLKSEGIGIIYITHRMSEITRIGDRITVLRDGKYIETLEVKNTTQESLVELMTGRVVDQIFPDIKYAPQEKLLELEDISVMSGTEKTVDSVSITVRAGEVVGIAGLVGSGKSEVGRACFGAETVVNGSIRLCNEILFDQSSNINHLTVRNMLDKGLFYVPSDRREEGLAMMLSVRENVSLAALELPKFSGKFFLRCASEKRIVKDILRKLDLSPLNIERSVENFSGGNQQKALVAKALVRIQEPQKPDNITNGEPALEDNLSKNVKVFIFDEPTVGVDIGARMLIYRAIRDLCESGAGVVLISSDLPEILHLAHRTYVMHRSKLQAELSAKQTTEQNVLSYFFDPEDK